MNTGSIGDFLAQLRKDHGLKQKEVADYLGTTDNCVSKWEHGNNLPDKGYLISLAELYNVEIEEILNGAINIEKRRKQKRNILINKIILIFLIVFIPILILLLIFFCVEYKSYNVYKMRSTSDENVISGYVIKKNNILLITGSILSIDKNFINEEELISVEVYYNKKLINTFNSLSFSYSVKDSIDINKITYKVFVRIKDKEIIKDVKMKYREYEETIKNKIINVNKIEDNDELINKKKLLDYGFVEKDDCFEYEDRNKYILIYKKNRNLFYYEFSDTIRFNINYYKNFNKIDVMLLSEYNNNKILLEKYTYNLNNKEVECYTTSCTSMEDMKNIIDFYATLAFGK